MRDDNERHSSEQPISSRLIRVVSTMTRAGEDETRESEKCAGRWGGALWNRHTGRGGEEGSGERSEQSSGLASF
jgi:hypothetical protein